MTLGMMTAVNKPWASLGSSSDSNCHGSPWGW